MRSLKSEPVLILGAVQAAIALAVSFGLNLTGAQVGAIVAFAAAILSVVCRQLVSPLSLTPPKQGPKP